MSDEVVSGAAVSAAYRKLAASVVLGALSSLAYEGSTNVTHFRVIQLYRSGYNTSKVARTLEMSQSSVRTVIDRLGPDPRSFLKSESPFIEHCGIAEGSIRGLVERIENDPEEAAEVLEVIRRWSRRLDPGVGGDSKGGASVDLPVVTT